MKYFIIAFNLLLILRISNAQQLNYIWHHNHDFEGNSSTATDVIPTVNGDLYAIYTHSDPIDADPEHAVIPTGANLDYYTIIKYNYQREYIWHKTLPAGSSLFNAKMKQAPNGDIYVYGDYNTAFDADPGPGVNMLSPMGFQGSGFIIHLDSNANYIDAVDIDAASRAGVYELDFDNLGNLYLTGTYGGTLDADPRSGVVNHVDGQFGGSYIIKLTPSMNYIWSIDINGGGGEYVEDIKVKGHEFYFSGESSQLTDIDPGPSTYMSSKQIYIIKFDTSGSFINAIEFDGPGDAPKIDFGYSNQMILSGVFQGTSFDADPGTGTFIIPSTSWWQKPYIISLDTNFSFNWAKSLETSNSSPNLKVSGVYFNKDGEIITAGRFKGDIDIDPSPSTNNITSQNNSADAYVAWYDNNGNLLSGHGILNNNGKYLGSFKLGPDYEVFVPLYYRGTIDIDPDSPTYNVTTSATTAGLLIEYSTCSPNVTIEIPTICKDDSYNIGSKSFTESGNYIYKFKTPNGCDSIVKVFLEVTKPSTKISQASDTLLVEPSGSATYQWYNCNIGMDVSGETNNYFVPSNNDAYSVVVMENGCIDTSVCVQFLQGNVKGSPKLVWAEDLDHFIFGEHNNLTTDKYGNLYICGQFCSRSDVSLRSDSIYYQEAGNSCDILIAKYDNDGNFLWGFPVGNASNSNVNEYATSIQIADDGSVYFAGNYIIDMDFDPDPDEEHLLTQPTPGCCTPHPFIAKLNENGQLIWVKGYGQGGFANVNSLALSPTGRLAITGEVTGVADMDPSTATVNATSGAYVAIYSTAGNFQDLINIPVGSHSWLDSYGHSVSFNSNDALVISGTSSVDFDFDLGPGTQMLTTNGADEYVYLAQYDASMNLDWAYRIGDYNHSIYPRTVVEHDCNDKLYFAGQGINNTGFGTNPFVIRYSENGIQEQSYPLFSTAQSSADNVDIDIDMYGNIFIAAKANGGDFFGSGTNLSGSNQQTFVAKYQADGTISWLFGIEDDANTVQTGITVDQSGNLFLASDGIATPFDVDPSTNNYFIDNFWGYVAKYGEDCSSLNTNIALNNGVIEIPENGMYIWKDCSNSSIIDTTFNQDFTPTTPGDYYAVVYQGYCIDSTGCVSVITTNIDNTENIGFEVYPNPTKDIVTIQSNSHEYIEIEILNALGKTIAKINMQNKADFNFEKLAKGIYYIKSNQGFVTKIIKN